MQGHDETRYAEAESSGEDRMPHVQYAAACPLVPGPSDETKYVQSMAPPLQGQKVEDSSVRLHDEGQAAADFFDRFSWNEIGLKHVPNGREEIKTARDGIQEPKRECEEERVARRQKRGGPVQQLRR